ncbi:zinc finger MYM-type protein 1-like protein [Tanacetum coccineum]
MKIEYEMRLLASIDCVRWCLHQGISFRAHDESDDSINMGNFKELHKFLIEHSEEPKKSILLNAPKNNKLTSHDIQIDIASACASETTKVIVDDIGDACFSILVDECRDVSTKEQMAIVIRYVNQRGNIVERFLGIVHVTDTCSSSLKEGIESLLSKHKLTLHQLQLVLVAVAKNDPDVAWLFTQISRLVNVVGGSCKRKDILREKQAEKIVEGMSLGEIEKEKRFGYCKCNGVNSNNTTAETMEIGDGWDYVSKKYLHFAASITWLFQRWMMHMNFQIEIFKAVIDWVLQELNNRFNEVTIELLLCMGCLRPNDFFLAFNKDKLVRLAELYPSDFSELDRVYLDDELETFLFDMKSELAMEDSKVKWWFLGRQWREEKRRALSYKFGNLLNACGFEIFSTLQSWKRMDRLYRRIWPKKVCAGMICAVNFLTSLLISLPFLVGRFGQRRCAFP